MSIDWKPGDVALIEVGCHANRHVGIFTGDAWRYADDKWAANDPAIITARPLVVIDPEDREQVERLLNRFMQGPKGDYIGGNADDLQDALRSLITPPKPEEPTGLGAVVEDGGREWIHFGNGCWIKSVPNAALETRSWWEFSDAVREVTP